MDLKSHLSTPITPCTSPLSAHNGYIGYMCNYFFILWLCHWTNNSWRVGTVSTGHAEAQGLACWWCSPNKYLLNEWMGEEMANLKCHLLQEVFLKGRKTQLFREEGSVSDAGRSCDAGLGPSCLHGSPGSSLPGTMSVGLSIALQGTPIPPYGITLPRKRRHPFWDWYLRTNSYWISLRPETIYTEA